MAGVFKDCHDMQYPVAPPAKKSWSALFKCRAGRWENMGSIYIGSEWVPTKGLQYYLSGSIRGLVCLRPGEPLVA